jgi:hypothetical protein
LIRKLSPYDFNSTLRGINDAPEAYKGLIPDDQWKEPYMSPDELKNETDDGVILYGWVEEDSLLGVMGIHTVQDSTLIRHSYVLTNYQSERANYNF